MLVSNIGKGPALECRCIGRLGAATPRDFRAPLFAVGAKSDLKTPRFIVELDDPAADAAALKFATRMFADLPDENWHEVLLCSDAFGNRWRFVRGRALLTAQDLPSNQLRLIPLRYGG